MRQNGSATTCGNLLYNYQAVKVKCMIILIRSNYNH